MKRKIFFYFFVTILLSLNTSNSQSLFVNSIDSLKNLVSSVNIRKYNREISGDTLTIVNSSVIRILSRKTTSPYNQIAAQYIYEKFVSFGLNTRFQVNSPTCVNVIATKTGTKYPNQYYVICSHYDDFSSNSIDTIPGADDNGSGTCAVLETARILSGFNSDYTIKFITFDEEEDMMVGSYAYVDSAYARGDSILGVLNLDMIGFDNSNTNIYDIVPNNASISLSSSLINSSYIYNIPTYPNEFVSESPGSDNLPFLLRGYKALLIMEHTFNTYYHTNRDKFDKMNLPYLTNVIKASLVTIASLSSNRHLSIIHTPPVSNYDTASRELVFKVFGPVKVNNNTSPPRLYYKVNSGTYTPQNAFYTSNDTLKFKIPSQLPASIINYYFALQDSAGSTCLTMPGGGSGMNPPGTVPPNSYYSYEIYSLMNFCSVTLPKPISDLQITSDTIPVNQNLKIVNKITLNLTLNHSNDGDLIIQLKGPNGMINLSQGNGNGGSNYINTTFDDSASVSITQGSPPFTGSFKPQSSLSYFRNQLASAPWVLRVFDSRTGNTGTLINWCILMELKNSVNIKDPVVPVNFKLYQNYPNPFNPVTNIKYSIAKKSFVQLKIFDVLGKEVATLVDGNQNAGEYLAVYNASTLSSGIYFYRLSAGDFKDIKRMIFIK